MTTPMELYGNGCIDAQDQIETQQDYDKADLLDHVDFSKLAIERD
ncbi:MAG: hypothetical protein ACK521_04510 [bacterium]|jgi:hypothetical protein